MAPGHAEEVNQPRMVDQVVNQAQDRFESLVQVLTEPIIKFSSKDYDCLAKNIFYESANEPEEGKVAVGVVTLNRSQDDRFGKSICEVVNKKTVFVRNKEITKTEMVQRGWFGKPEPVVKKETVLSQVPVCQFSWVCAFVKKPNPSDERWQESQRIARELLDGGYTNYRVKYQDAVYFHATYVRPQWAGQKRHVGRIGGHIFYAERNK